MHPIKNISDNHFIESSEILTLSDLTQSTYDSIKSVDITDSKLLLINNLGRKIDLVRIGALAQNPQIDPSIFWKSAIEGLKKRFIEKVDTGTLSPFQIDNFAFAIIKLPKLFVGKAVKISLQPSQRETTQMDLIKNSIFEKEVLLKTEVKKLEAEKAKLISTIQDAVKAHSAIRNLDRCEKAFFDTLRYFKSEPISIADNELKEINKQKLTPIKISDSSLGDLNRRISEVNLKLAPFKQSIDGISQVFIKRSKSTIIKSIKQMISIGKYQNYLYELLKELKEGYLQDYNKIQGSIQEFEGLLESKVKLSFEQLQNLLTQIKKIPNSFFSGWFT
jgi:hypothetical protein